MSKTTPLQSVDDALDQILATVNRLPSESVPLSELLGRTLASDIHAADDLPPFANSSMDGFALRAADIAGANADNPATLQVTMDIPAGVAPSGTLQAGQAARIMTGAPLPDGADSVVPVEETDAEWQSGDNPPLPPSVQVRRSVNAGDYVRPVGESIRSGQKVLDGGTVLRPQDIGVLASLGFAHAPVVRKPRVAVLSTGDELVAPGDSLTPGKIRDSNSYAVAALIESLGAEAIRLPIAKDTLDDVRRLFRQALDDGVDVLVSSAGVSVGTYDVVRTVLDELGEVNFWRVNMRPGKPLAYGHLQNVPFFGLPGNPVSAMITFDVFVRPALLKMLGTADATPMATAVLGEDLNSDGRRSYLRVTLTKDGDTFVAHSTGTQSSGALLSMVLADGLIIVPEGVTQVAKGETLPVRLLRQVF